MSCHRPLNYVTSIYDAVMAWDGMGMAWHGKLRVRWVAADCEWDVEQYGKLLAVGGGKERMTAHWNGGSMGDRYTTQYDQNRSIDRGVRRAERERERERGKRDSDVFHIGRAAHLALFA